MRNQVVFTLLLLALSPLAHAGVPAFVTYSGRLTDGTGWGESTEATLVFHLYDAADAQASFWTTTHPGVAVVDGYFTVNLGMCNEDGSSCTVNPAEATFPVALPDQMWVAVVVDDVELGRQPVGSVPYARRADRTEIEVGGRRWSVNAVFRGTTTGKLSPADGDGWDMDGATVGRVSVSGHPVGYVSAKAACEIALSSPTAHLCSGDEMLRSAQLGILPTDGVTAWLATPGSDYYDNQSGGKSGVRDCDGWTEGTVYDNNNLVLHGHQWNFTGGRFTHASCAGPRPLACCDFP